MKKFKYTPDQLHASVIKNEDKIIDAFADKIIEELNSYALVYIVRGSQTNCIIKHVNPFNKETDERYVLYNWALERVAELMNSKGFDCVFEGGDGQELIIEF